MEQPPLGFSIAEEKNQTVLKAKQVKKLAAPSGPSNLLPNLLPNLWEHKREIFERSHRKLPQNKGKKLEKLYFLVFI